MQLLRSKPQSAKEHSAEPRSTSPHPPLQQVDLLGMSLACCTEQQLLEQLSQELEARRGGWLVTANLDFLRRHHIDARLRALYAEADLRVADGMPLVWAAWLQGTPLPERIAGASLMRPLADVASRVGRRLYLLGGDTGVAEQAANVLRQEFPRLEIAGWSSPMLPAEPGPEAVLPLIDVLRDARADLVLVALGSPKQEWLIQKLRAALPACWFVGVGMSFSFLVGHMARAPQWMQKSGLEWLHRLLSEPRRLGTRYLVHGAPFGLELLARSALRRLAGPRT
jgi:N-acetylglucosaminyldiphosphoundecaprenol N-acetyl-beta-D-mannosaminyltransferase